MAFRSLAQMNKFKQLVAEGKLSPQIYKEWEKGTIVSALPDRITASSPKPIEHEATKRHKRMARKKRVMSKKRSQRKKPTQRKKRKMRVLPI